MAAFKDVGVQIENAVGEGITPRNGDGAERATVALASIAKARTFNTTNKKRGSRPATIREDRAGLATDDDALQMSPERLFFPGAKDPLVLRPHTPERFLVEQLRDEAHRFAITAHRNRRKARTLRSVLEEIPGVGPAKRKALLKAFGSAEGVAAADVAALGAVSGVGPALAARILQALNGPPSDAAAGARADDGADDVSVDDGLDEQLPDDPEEAP